MLSIVSSTPEPKKKPRKRAGPYDWRSISRAAAVKDGRPLILAFIDEDNPDNPRIEAGYFHKPTRKWWLANTAPEHGFDAASDLYGDPVLWLPMPDKKSITDAHAPRAKKAKTAPRETAVKRPLKMAHDPICKSTKKSGNLKLSNGFSRLLNGAKNEIHAH